MININVKGWNSQTHRELPGNLESTKLGRKILSREIGRTRRHMPEAMQHRTPRAAGHVTCSSPPSATRDHVSYGDLTTISPTIYIYI